MKQKINNVDCFGQSEKAFSKRYCTPLSRNSWRGLAGGHPQGKGVPAQLWQRALDEQFVPRLPPSRNDLLVLLTRTTKRKVHHYGIEFENLIYQSPALAPLRSKLARAKKHRTTHSEIAQDKEDDIKAGIVQIKYHPGDLSRIWVLDPFVSEYIEVLAVDQQYTKDLSLWKHHVISRYVREELKRQVDTEALVLARARLQQLIADEMRLTRTIRSRQTMARWWNEQVTTWINEQAADTSQARLSAKEPTASPSLSSPEREQEAPPLSPSEQASVRTPPEHPSVADLSAPLPPLQEQVALLKEQVAVGNTTPFSAFPPLASEEHSPKAATETPTEPHGGTPPIPQTTRNFRSHLPIRVPPNLPGEKGRTNSTSRQRLLCHKKPEPPLQSEKTALALKYVLHAGTDTKKGKTIYAARLETAFQLRALCHDRAHSRHPSGLYRALGRA